MSTEFGLTDLEYKIIMHQIERRARYRKEFMRARSNPCKPKESSYVFDEAIQRFMSMKTCQLDHFTANPRTIRAGVFMLVLPMTTYGYVVWTQRQKFLKKISTGELKYKDRMFKLQ